MKPKTRYLTSGLFLAAGLLAAAVVGLWFADYRGPLKTVKVVSDIPVTGLVKYSTVTYRGVEVGSITDIALNPENPQEIWVDTRISTEVPITTATYASLNLAGVTGDTQLVLDADAAPGAPASEVRVRYSLLDTLERRLVDVVEQTGKLVGDIDALVVKSGKGGLTSLIDDIDTVALRLGELEAQLTPLAKQANLELVPAVDALLEQLRKTGENLDDLIVDFQRDPQELLRGRESKP